MDQGSDESSCVVKWDDSLADYEAKFLKGQSMTQEVERMVEEQMDISSQGSSFSDISDYKSAMKSSLTLELKDPDSPVNDGYTEPTAGIGVSASKPPSPHCSKATLTQYLEDNNDDNDFLNIDLGGKMQSTKTPHCTDTLLAQYLNNEVDDEELMKIDFAQYLIDNEVDDVELMEIDFDNIKTTDVCLKVVNPYTKETSTLRRPEAPAASAFFKRGDVFIVTGKNWCTAKATMNENV